MVIDFSNILTFLVWYGITAFFLMMAYLVKKSVLAFVPIVYFLIILQLTARNPMAIENLMVHRVFNFIGLGLSLVLYIVIDDIETRRKVISQVFKNRYKNRKKGKIEENQKLEIKEKEDFEKE